MNGADFTTWYESLPSVHHEIVQDVLLKIMMVPESFPDTTRIFVELLFLDEIRLMVVAEYDAALARKGAEDIYKTA